MQVGKNSYVTLEEANNHIAERYAYNDAARLRWNSLPDTSKEAHLLNACAEIESLQFLDCKATPGQLMSFPRGRSGDIPHQVKAAQVEIALQFSDTSQRHRQELQAQGVKSYTIGELSEHFSGQAQGLGTKAHRLLLPFLTGGFEVC